MADFIRRKKLNHLPKQTASIRPAHGLSPLPESKWSMSTEGTWRPPKLTCREGGRTSEPFYAGMPSQCLLTQVPA
jgi:hypothetical protein